MAYKDLRTYMRQIEEIGELKRITVEVDWDGEVGAITRRLFKQKHRPALLFENVKDSTVPLLTGVMLDEVKYGLMTDTEPVLQKLAEHNVASYSNRIDPVMVESGPCQENVVMGDDVNLYMFPSPHWHPLDGGRYIGTLGVVISKDPETGIRNLGIYRQQLQGKNKMGLNCEQHTGIHMAKNRAAGKPTPIVTCIGVPPAVLIAAASKPAYGIDEYGIAGGLAGVPIPLVKCKTVDLEVPADTEIVIEGYIPANNEEWELEGPFGEFHGHFNDPAPAKRPSAIVTCVTYRNNPIFQACSPGVGPNEVSFSGKLAYLASFKNALIAAGIPGVKEVNVTEMGCAGFVAVVSLSKHFYKGIPQAVYHQLFSLGHFPKIVVVVDDDIDVFDDGMVQWAIASRVQPHRDIEITPANTWGCPLDPSIPLAHRRMPGTTSSRMGIDATKFFKDDVIFSPLVLDDAATVAAVTARWNEYGFVE